MGWEYNTVAVYLQTKGVVNRSTFPDITELDRLGALGWEVCAWSPAPPDHTAARFAGWAILKRPL